MRSVKIRIGLPILQIRLRSAKLLPKITGAEWWISMRKSISFNQSHKSNLAHNNRENVHGNPDIDQSRLEDNIYFVQKDIREVYREVFQEAVDAYNAKQSRQDRKINDYFSKIYHDKKTHEQRELIVAIGKGEDGEEFRSLKKSALIEYAKEFQERNPNLAVYNMVLHDDEANPHLHINYVPNFESKRGLTRRVGMDKALHQQGIRVGEKENSMKLIGEWRALETARIEELANEHIERFERANVGSHKYMNVRQYKEYAESLRTLQGEVENQKADLEAIEGVKEVEKAKLSDLEQRKSELTDEIKMGSANLLATDMDLSMLREKVKSTEEELQRSTEKLAQLKKEVSAIETPLVELDSIKTTERRFKEEIIISKKDYAMVMDMAKKSLDENKNGLALVRENQGLKEQVTEYQKTQQEQIARIETLREQRDKHRDESNRLEKENKTLLRERNFFKIMYEKVKDWLKSKGYSLENLEKEERRVKREEQQKEKTVELGRE